MVIPDYSGVLSGLLCSFARLTSGKGSVVGCEVSVKRNEEDIENGIGIPKSRECKEDERADWHVDKPDVRHNLIEDDLKGWIILEPIT